MIELRWMKLPFAATDGNATRLVDGIRGREYYAVLQYRYYEEVTETLSGGALVTTAKGDPEWKDVEMSDD